jgi:uncharacterized membrane protein YtjA (UPF0391 family)
MIKWSIIFLLSAIICGTFGFIIPETGAAKIAQMFFGFFLFLFIGPFIFGYSEYKKIST